MQVGIAAGIVAGITVLALGVRTLAGMRRWKEILSLSLAIVILGVFSGIGMSQQALIHRWQAQYLEGQHNWQPAITQYERSGEGAPASDAIGRVFVEWGEQLSQEQHYEMALARYNVVLGQYFAAKAQVLRAQSDSIKALIQWGKQSMNQKDYVGAATHFDALFNLTYCNSSCQAAASLLDAQAYYQLAEAKFALGQFEDAVNFFRQITTRFSNSPEAQKIHPDFAQALLGQGKLQLTTSCNSAIPTYQELVTSFADTPQGQQAIKEIKAPQLVKGHFASYIPSFPLTPLVALLPKLYANMPAQEFFQLLNTSPKVVVQSDGSFNFQPVKQGTYYLTWGTVSSTGSTSFSFVSNHSSGELIYVAHVGPLCPYDFQTIYQPFSLAP
jgi:tetratricopeptide (TPR) repeat protein